MTQRLLYKVENKLNRGNYLAEQMKSETRRKAQEICQRVAVKGSQFKEESERQELEKADTFLKKLEKKAKAVEKFQKA